MGPSRHYGGIHPSWSGSCDRPLWLPRSRAVRSVCETVVRHGVVSLACAEGELSAEPAPFPGAGPARTMFAALFGELAFHPWPDAAGERSQDAYSLFYARSVAMGWLTRAVEGATGGLWGMNDAEAGPAAGRRPQRVAWFQVVLTGPFPGKLLPVQPFLACVGDVVARLGRLRLEAVQVLLPERDAPEEGYFGSPSGMRVAWPFLNTPDWFADCDPQLRVSVRVTLDGGSDPSVRAAAPAILQWVQEVRQGVFACESLSLADDDHLILRPIPFEDPAADAVHHRVSFSGTLAEWSLDALGWLAAFIAEGASRHGVSTPLMLTADRSST
jgi:hypothetical protein